MNLPNFKNAAVNNFSKIPPVARCSDFYVISKTSTVKSFKTYLE